MQTVEKWFNRVHNMQLNEYVPPGLRSHVFVMRMMGMWPSTNDSPSYKWLAVTLLLPIGLLFNLSLFVNIFFVTTMENAMRSCLSLSGWVVTFKAVIFYCRCNSIRHLFHIHVILLRDDGHDVEKLNRNARLNTLIHVAVTTLYCMACCMGLVQIFSSKPKDRWLPSTVHYPFDFTQSQSVHLILLSCQCVCNVIMIILAAVQDSLCIAMIGMTCNHVTELRRRLENIGKHKSTKDDDLDLVFYKDLVDCCERYENCLRCSFYLLELIKVIQPNRVQFWFSAMQTHWTT